VYYDGQMDDARFNVTLAVTAALHGSVIANHTEVSASVAVFVAQIWRSSAYPKNL